MLVILASQQDEVARLLAMRWSPHEVCLLTPQDLSTVGWRYHLPASTSTATSTAMIAGRKLEPHHITGMLTRLPRVYAGDLEQVAADDRSYVSAEMSSFLVAWLSQLTCPVLNRPVPGCLAGPNWRKEQWVHLAAQLGIPICPIERSTSGATEVATPANPATVVVVGDRLIGTAPPRLKTHARRLAQAAAVELLAVEFDGAHEDAAVLGANPWPDLFPPEVSSAVLNYFLRRSKC